MNNNDTPQKGVSIGIPGYTILGELGKGGMATVYLAIQECFGRKVALKVMDPNLLIDNTFGERFLREAHIVAGLSHPHIIAVYDVGVHENYHFIAMEYHSGGDLQGRITQGLAPEDAVAIIQQTALALDYAHKKGYIHRDVKPDNILFREDGSAVLTDFGIAKPQTASKQMTQVGKVVGTPKYMSPEQARGVSIDSRSDIYSLGIVLFEALTGEAPFDGTDPIAIGIKHLRDPVPTLPPHIACFQQVMDTVLEKNPDERYQSGQEFIEALDDIEFLHADGFIRPPKGKTISTPSGRSKRVRTIADQPAPFKKAPWILGSIVAGIVILMALPPFIMPNNSAVQTIYGLQSKAQPNQTLENTEKKVVTATPRTAPQATSTTQVNTKKREQPVSQKPQERIKKEANQHNAVQPTVNKPAPAESSELTINTTAPLPLEEKDSSVSSPLVATDEQTLSAVEPLESSAPLEESNISTEATVTNEAPEQILAENEAPLEENSTHPVITQLLNEAKTALDNNRLTRPENDSAFSKYTEVLTIDPSNSEAKNGLKSIAALLVTEAKKARDNNQFKVARGHLENAESIDPLTPQLDEIKASINNAEKKEQAQKIANANKAQTFADKFRITGLLRSAEQDMLQEKFTLPTETNAYSKYREVLKIDSSNDEAKQGIANIKKQLPLAAQKAIETQSANAQSLIQQLKIIDSKKALALESKL